MLKKRSTRQVATLLMLSSVWWLVATPKVRAQSSVTQSETEAEQQDTNTDNSEAASEVEKNNSAEEETSKEQAEFDDLILGPWVILANISDGLPKPSEIKTSLRRCFASPKISKLQIESGAERKLPDPKNLAGDMVYYRTGKGLQRFDFSQGYLVLLTNIEKVELEGKPTTWSIQGSKAKYRIRFASKKNNGGGGQFMIENTNVYLRCPRPNKDKKTTDQ